MNPALITAEKIPGAKAQTMQAIGHFPMSEDHETFMRYVGPVLNEIREQARVPA